VSDRGGNECIWSVRTDAGSTQVATGEKKPKGQKSTEAVVGAAETQEIGK
jgi:hypothetical protein